MELRHLRYFVAVAEELSFTQAARRLGMAQPPLSQQISRLERELGVLLLERHPRVRLTPAGAIMLDEARTLLTRSQETTRIVSQVGSGHSGAVRIGCVASGLSGVLAVGLRAFRAACPEVLPLVHEMEAVPQLEALHHGTIDIGFLRSSGPHPGLDLWPLLGEPLVAVLPDTHPAAQQPRTVSVDLATLADQPFVLFPRAAAPEAFDAIAAACRTAGFAPDVVHEISNDHTLVSLIAAGLGVSLVPRSTTNLTMTGVVYRDITPVARAATLAAAIPTDRSPGPAHHLLDVLQRAYAT